MTVLINAQWHGSGCGHRYPIGAERIRNMLGSKDVVIPDISYRAGSDEVIQGVRNLGEICNALDAVETALSVNPWAEPIFNLGCDCGGELVPISLLNRKYNGELRVIWFDAHPDLNSVETTESNTFHGMVLRMLLGDIPAPLSKYLDTPLQPENVILAGIRDIDASEQNYIEQNNLSVIEPNDIAKPPNHQQLLQLANSPVFVHVDYDVLDPQHHGNTAFGTKNGVALEDLLEWIKFIQSHFNVVGYGLTEFAPSSILSDDTDVRRILQGGFGLKLCP